MSNAFGIKALMPNDASHILGMGAARTGATDLLLDVWNGSTSAARVFSVQKDGRVQMADGSVSAPVLTFTGDLDSGIYRIGADNIGVALNGAKVLDIGTATVAVTGALTASGAITAGGALAVGGAVTGVTNLTASGNITGTWQGTAVAAQYGGTGWSSYIAGDILYAATTTTLAQLGIGAANRVLTSSGSAPQWSSSLTLAGSLTVGVDVTITGDLTVNGTATISVTSVAASSITAGTFGAGNYIFPADLDVTGVLSLADDVELASVSVRLTENAVTPKSGFTLTGVTVTGATSNTVATGSDYKAFMVVGGQSSGIFGWNGGTTLTTLGLSGQMVSGAPGASEVGITISAAGVVTITHGTSVTSTRDYGVYIFSGGN